jgi:hypothetical protein
VAGWTQCSVKRLHAICAQGTSCVAASLTQNTGGAAVPGRRSPSVIDEARLGAWRYQRVFRVRFSCLPWASVYLAAPGNIG